MNIEERAAKILNECRGMYQPTQPMMPIPSSIGKPIPDVVAQLAKIEKRVTKLEEKGNLFRIREIKDGDVFIQKRTSHKFFYDNKHQKLIPMGEC